MTEIEQNKNNNNVEILFIFYFILKRHNKHGVLHFCIYDSHVYHYIVCKKILRFSKSIKKSTKNDIEQFLAELNRFPGS